MMTSWNGNIFRVSVHLCGEFTGPRWITRTKASGFDVFFDLRLNKRLSKQSGGWWFETLSRSLWRHCIVTLRNEWNKGMKEIGLAPAIVVVTDSDSDSDNVYSA